MSASATWKQSLRLTARKASAHWPGIAQLRRRLYEARFRAGKYHCGYSGRFAGFDHDAMADIGHYTTMAGGIEPMPATEYPVLFWLRAALDERARTLLDLGGYVGHAFRQYDRYLAFPDAFRWTVFDLPHITRAGEALAAVIAVGSWGAVDDQAAPHRQGDIPHLINFFLRLLIYTITNSNHMTSTPNTHS